MAQEPAGKYSRGAGPRRMVFTRIDNMRIASNELAGTVRWMSGSLKSAWRDRVRTNHGYDARRFSDTRWAADIHITRRMDGASICL
ncbi:beta-propeller fold lactonase family protein [Salmonella enterica subsp. enterica serovar Weltevreden]|nr:beta-propeller fold lactonase family protein [Salmonella enterica subsp. enterica serovar Weltevreden]